MNISFNESLKKILLRHQEIGKELSKQNIGSEERINLSKEYSELEPIVNQISLLESKKKELLEKNIILEDSNVDDDMYELASSEKETLNQTIPDITSQIQKLLLPKHKDDDKDAIVEIRAGTGGNEASLFASELLRMYQRYADHKSWKSEILSLSETDIGGCKEAVLALSGIGAFMRLKFESGVHRVQRVPTTETSGRIHTSAATVAVLPKVEQLDIEINAKDIRIDTFRSQGAGGQHVNTTDSAVRITHLPTGIVASCQDEKSQHKNKSKAMQILRARVYEKEQKALQIDRDDTRRAQIGTGDRSERIRTYNYPQGRVTDHRIDLTLYKIESILSGEMLDEIINPLISEDEAARLIDFAD